MCIFCSGMKFSASASRSQGFASLACENVEGSGASESAPQVDDREGDRPDAPVGSKQDSLMDQLFASLPSEQDQGRAVAQ